MIFFGVLLYSLKVSDGTSLNLITFRGLLKEFVTFQKIWLFINVLIVGSD